ncbi:MAG: GlsB/YeaQ/YmgE family stress response membrane protein [Bdellovibrionaceae bacterium]|nr:GlsB/YeaQ/YmgE family stress response membrane protein [Pseudobdellovibrionaceae bacterium]
MNVLLFLVVGLFAGWIASSLMKGQGMGLVGNLVVGMVGAFLGGLLFDMVGVVTHGFWSSLGMSVIGAMIFLFLIGLISGNFLGRRHFGQF